MSWVESRHCLICNLQASRCGHADEEFLSARLKLPQSAAATTSRNFGAQPSPEQPGLGAKAKLRPLDPTHSASRCALHTL